MEIEGRCFLKIEETPDHHGVEEAPDCHKIVAQLGLRMLEAVADIHTTVQGAVKTAVDKTSDAAEKRRWQDVLTSRDECSVYRHDCTFHQR